mmetsp:Transcript_21967/g.33539  ORF Transcript_21967/g.33539 Transcript_21967/m.33539 type:complete len:764 (-) Transcript_21967:18-2309(-)
MIPISGLSSLLAPDVFITLLILAYLQYKQSKRRTTQKGKVHTGKVKPKLTQHWSLCHELFFTHLHMMVSPYAEQASNMNAEMVNLQSDQELDSFTKKVASGKTPRKNTKKQPSRSKNSGGGTMEVRSRRIRTGELVYNPYFIAFETTFIFAFAFLIGLASRWMFGLIRSLKLSSPLDGYCCSPYRGGDDDASRLPGAFGKLLACVLVKGSGDDAFNGYGGLVLILLVRTIRLASLVSAPHKSDFDDESEETKEDGTFKRIHPTKAKRFIAFCLVTLASLWMFHTPSLLRFLGLDGLTEAIEECAARILLLGNLLGAIDLSSTGTIPLDKPPVMLQTVMNVLLILLALTYGYIASSMMTPINETARNAAHVLSPSPTKKQTDPSEMFQLMNARMMLIIQGMAPLVIMFTYVFHSKFAEAEKHRGRKNSFSSNYLQNSALFLRVALSWCFVGASIYTFRSMVQSFLDQTATVASAMAALGEAGSDAKASKQNSTAAPSKVDPFSDRYGKIVYTAGRLAALPTFIFTLLVISHLYGGSGDAHPGVGHKSQPKNAPRPVFTQKGLLPPYAGNYMSWIDRKSRPNNNGFREEKKIFLHAAVMSESLRNPTPFRDWAHNKVVDVLGKKNFCRAPDFRSVSALDRHVRYLLETDDDGNRIDTVMTTNAMTGRELLVSAPVLKNAATATCDTSMENEDGECKATVDEDSPPLRLVVSSLLSHPVLTPTVVFPIIDSLAFLSSAWWTYWFSVKTIVYYIGLKGAAGAIQISS